MKLLIRLFCLSIFLSTAHAGISQESVPEFTIQIGNFVNPQPSDFEQLKSMGFVYSVKRPTNHTDVFLGGFSSEIQAKQIAEKLREQGYENAFVSRLNTEGGQPATVIQLATLGTGEKINWEKMVEAGPLFVLLNDKQVKVLAGGYADINAAKADLARVRSLGYSDAFVKNVNNALLHTVSEFETGGLLKKALIPLDFTEKEMVASNEKKKAIPESYEEVTIIQPKPEEPVMTARGATETPTEVKNTGLNQPEPVFAFKADRPEIRSNVKRTSAIELQKVLKEEGTYKGALDGYYGKGTQAGYNQVVNANRQLQKYAILSRFTATPAGEAPANSVQYHMDNLWTNTQASLNGLEAAQAPIAKAYRAYYRYATQGPGAEVNSLMNKAIRDAFGNTSVRVAGFDPSFTYDYRDLDQLLTHIRYIHEVSAGQPAAPCWLFRRHPGTALKAFGGGSATGNPLHLQSCGGFWEWQEVQLLNAITADIATSEHTSEAQMTDSQSELARLYLAPPSIEWNERKALKEWNDQLWQGIDAWSTRDPMLAEISTALKISYFQTQVMLEDFYMNEGFDKNVAEGLALAALKSLVGHRLERFV